MLGFNYTVLDLSSSVSADVEEDQPPVSHPSIVIVELRKKFSRHSHEDVFS